MKLGKKLEHFEAYAPFPYAGQIRLDANESCFALPEDIQAEVLRELAKVDFARYPDPNAVALCAAFGGYYNIPVENTVAGNGSDELIGVIIGSVLSKDDRVVVTAPDFSMYRFYCEVNERPCFVYGKNGDFSFDVMKIAEFIVQREISFFIFSNPGNPTGRRLPVEDIRYLLEHTDCTVCVDEAYMDFSEGSVLNLVNEFRNLIVLKTLSKNIGLAALRVGFAVSCPENVACIKKAKSPYNLNSLSQKAAETVLRHREYLDALRQNLIASRRALQAALRELEDDHFTVFESDANFVYIKTAKANEIYNGLLQKGIVVRCFPDGYLRITAGTESENAYLVQALAGVKGRAV